MQAIQAEVEAQRQQSADLAAKAKAYARSISKQRADNAQVKLGSHMRHQRQYVRKHRLRLRMSKAASSRQSRARR